jgi:hypothetical protein
MAHQMVDVDSPALGWIRHKGSQLHPARWTGNTGKSHAASAQLELEALEVQAYVLVT